METQGCESISDPLMSCSTVSLTHSDALHHPANTDIAKERRGCYYGVAVLWKLSNAETGSSFLEEKVDAKSCLLGLLSSGHLHTFDICVCREEKVHSPCLPTVLRYVNRTMHGHFVSVRRRCTYNHSCPMGKSSWS